MISPELQKKIQLIQIKTKRKLNALLVGSSSSIIKGSGYDFDQIREYVPGDDIRFVDFKSSAKMGKLFVRQYLEERNRTIIILVDVSASSFFSSTKMLKHEVVSEIASVIAMAANHCKDRVGVALFTDRIIKFIPPSKGNAHINNIMEELFIFNNEQGQTSIDFALKDWMKKVKKKSIVFLISDFIDSNSFEKALGIVANYSDLIAIKYNDKIEGNLPQVGLINFQDIETGENFSLNISKNINLEINNYFMNQEKILKKHKVSFLNINNHEDYISQIIKFFNKRLMY
ncbi:MAG: DUF58 domain-containing protein [Candidatus Babeliales bacterium]|nr:DUF58 domain-containing protein [Candidatus Babeliales bacterium]